MEAKKKYCSGCDSEQYIWKNFEGVKYCKSCWSCHKSNNALQKPKIAPSSSKLKQKSDKQKAITPKSQKRIKQDKIYTAKRIIFMLEHPLCQVNIPGLCTSISTDIHHTYSGANRSQFYLDEKTFLAVCRSCHSWIHNESIYARKLGYLK